MTFAARRRKGPYEAINYHRFADDMVITISGHWSKRGWAERALQRLQGAIGNPAGRAQPREDQNGRHVEGRSLRVPRV